MIVLRRIARYLPTFIGTSLVTFILLRLSPGAPGLIGDALDSAGMGDWRALRADDQPLVLGYLEWLGRCLRLDFGRSLIDQRPVAELLAEALPKTLLVAGSALLVTYAIAVPLGVIAADRRGLWDRGVAAALFVAYSVPSFWLALVLVILFAGGDVWAILPLRGLASPELEGAGLVRQVVDGAWHLILPVTCLALPALARVARVERAAMIDALAEPYVRAAYAKGLTRRAVVWRHAFPNALVPTAAMLAVDLPVMVGGSLVVERIFTIRGMGLLTFEAILRRDYPVVLGVTAVVAMVTIGAMLAGDLLHLWLDPRARRGAA